MFKLISISITSYSTITLDEIFIFLLTTDTHWSIYESISISEENCLNFDGKIYYSAICSMMFQTLILKFMLLKFIFKTLLLNIHDYEILPTKNKQKVAVQRNAGDKKYIAKSVFCEREWLLKNKLNILDTFIF